ncbi:MAG: metallophosphoesterase family protein [Herpetosiphonaceae bacterium]|nr:metallophosphoesterase family protein [Herpetosiphonaceae bacterium]
MISDQAVPLRIGIVSDTHGVLHPGVHTVFMGVSQIWHAGDVGAPAIIDELAMIAPVTAVRGNIDAGKPWAQRLPEVQQLLVSGVQLFMTHVGAKPAKLVQRLPEPRPDVYIFGHSHHALLVRQAGVLFLNPGAAGRPRFGGRLSVAVLHIDHGAVEAEIIPL